MTAVVHEDSGSLLFTQDILLILLIDQLILLFSDSKITNVCTSIYNTNNFNLTKPCV